MVSQSSVTGSRVVKMSLAKQERDTPSSGRITGFEVRMWYRRQRLFARSATALVNAVGNAHLLDACAGDIAMLAMTVAKPGAADKFRCQRRVFLKLVLRV